MEITITKDSLVRDITKLRVKQGETLLVHSSMKSLRGFVEGGCATVIEAFLTVLGEDGTLLMPTLTCANVTRQSPFFSVRNTQSCVGKLTEAFRTTPGVIRSVHPTHSVCAYGRLAKELTEDHIHDNTPVGPNSPFRRMMPYGGRILMLGCGLTHDTFMHGVEEEAGVPYCLSPDPIDFTCELADGQRITITHTPHYFLGVTQRYDRVGTLLNEAEMQQGKIAAADCYILDSNALWEKAEAKIREEPFFFVNISENNIY